jgi:ribosome-binding factor A
VIDCALSPDYRHATIKVSILADRDAEVRKILKMLEDARGYVQRGVAGRLRTRVTPELRFELDRGAEQSVKISSLLDDLKKEREQREGGVPPPADAEAEAEEAEALAGDEEEEFDGDLWEEYEDAEGDDEEDDDEGR